MFGSGLHTRRLAAGERRSALVMALLCLAMLVPALPGQFASAAPVAAPASSLRARQPDRPLIAFLRQGNLWLMNADGSSRRQVTISEAPVEDFSWSPSGRYLVFQHGGRYRVQGNVEQADLVTDLLDTATGEISELYRQPANNGMSVGGSNLPVWAPDADELLLLDFDPSEGRTYSLRKLALDGTSTVLASFEEPYICGGQDGPFATLRQLAYLQQGGPWTRRTYDPVIWRAADPMAYAYVMCGTSRAVDLATGSVSELPYRPLTAVGEQVLVQGEGASWSTPSLYDPATGRVQPLYEGNVFASGPDGAIYFTRIVQGAPSTFASRFDDVVAGAITDNVVELWRTDGEASEPVLIASIPAFAAGMPRVTDDGAAVVFGTVDNPTDMIGIDESGVDWFTPEVYADHLKAVRVDIATGEVTVLADHAILPKPQPAGLPAAGAPASDDGPTDLTGTPTATAPEATAEPTEVATEATTEPTAGSVPPIEPGSDWIAYVGEDGNIWLMQPDGSQQTQVSTDGTADFPYRQPSWSHDGTMLVFSRQATYTTTEPSFLYLFRDGMVSRVPHVYGCDAAAFMPGDQQLVLGCASDSAEIDVPASTLQTDPSMGFVSVANLDGSDWRILMPYLGDGWPNVGRAWVYDISVAADGTILLNWGGPGGDSMALIPSGSGSATRLDSPLETGAVTGKFSPGSDDILISACKGCYKHTREDAQHTVAWMDRNGAITTTLFVPDPTTRIGQPTIAPDGMTLVYTIRGSGYPFYGTIQSRDLAHGTDVTIAAGMEPAWQPNAGVEMQRPASAATTDSGSATSTNPPPPTEAASGAVPSEFIATWSGRGVQENPYGEWAVTIGITGGGVGEVVGTSEYPEESCGGNLVLQEVTAGSIVLLEQLTYGQETCADNGTITLSGIDGVAVQFSWSGIGPYGTPSTASGTLYRPDSATGAPATGGGASVQPGTQDGPVVDTTQLDPYYIGTFSGTGKQTDPDNEWPITVTFTGGRPGEMIGTVEYLTLGCGGELILDSINPNDEWRGFRVTERITYGHDNCIDGGTFAFSMAESGIGITFGWTSPVSATRASGHLPKVEPGVASTQGSMEPVHGGDAITSFVGTWEGMGTQSNTGATWPITFSFTGGAEGEIVGTVDYPTLGCGGELTLLRNLLMPGVTSGIEVSEHIIYGADNCIDGGTFTFWLAEGGGKTGFNWVSPDGSITARGPIDMVQPGTEAPFDQSEAATQEPVDPGTSGGPPSIYDEPEAEPVPIEAEGG